jgi:hypothetical protein
LKLPCGTLLAIGVALAPLAFANAVNLVVVFNPTGTSPGTGPCVIGGLDDVVCDLESLSDDPVVSGDPVVVFHPPSQNGGSGPPQVGIIGLSFSFITPTGNSPLTKTSKTSPCVIGGLDDTTCDFLNLSGETWKALEFTASPGGDLSSCEPSYGFTTCDIIKQGGPGSPTVFLLYGGKGIANDKGFDFVAQGWAADTTFDVVANVPEPSKTTLFLAGLLTACLVIKRTSTGQRPN